MKRLTTQGEVLLVIFLMLLTACTEESVLIRQQVGDLHIEEISIADRSFFSLSGNVSENTTLSADREWLLTGRINVLEGATLTIEAGTRIYGAFGDETAFLSVQRGGQINASGTAEAPIRFSTIRELTSVPQPGDWGGIILNGRAPINAGGGVANGEGGTGAFGGDDPADNSGTLRYVIVAYAGKQLGEGNELNSFSFNGVGNSTTLEYLQALYGKDDGFEFFGGTCNLRCAVSLGSGDDSFDWSLGWQGKGQYWIAQQGAYDGDAGIEADNNEDDYSASPHSNPVISNFALIGAWDGDDKNSGIVLRRGTKGILVNGIVRNFSNNGIEVKDEETLGHLGRRELHLDHVIAFDNALYNVEGKNFVNRELMDNPNNSEQRRAGLDGWIGYSSQSLSATVATDPWFEQVNFIGALDPSGANEWTAHWTEELR